MARILILANSDLGLYKFRKELIVELLKENEVFISLPNGEFIDKLIQLGCIFVETEVDRRGLNPISDLLLVLKYNKLIRNIKPDLVITYTIKSNIYGGFVSKVNNIDYVANITGLGTTFQKENMLNKLITMLYKVSLNKSKIALFENLANQLVFVNKSFLNKRIIAEEKTHILNGAGVNLDEYKFTSYPNTNNGVRFLFIGRIMKEKGIDELFAAAKKIKGEYNNIEIDIVGPEEDRYLEILKDLEDKKIINYYGFQTDVRPFIQHAHCFVLPSYHEGMANTLLERGAKGRPLIASDISGCKEAIVDGESGYLTKVGDADHLYNTMRKFLELSYESKKQMGYLSRKHVENEFNKDKIVSETLQLIK